MHAILIWFDRLPYGLLGCSGNTQAQTPGFDRFAAAGVTFDNCFADDLRSDGIGGLIETLLALAQRDVTVRLIAVGETTLAGRVQSLSGIPVTLDRLPVDADVVNRLIDVVERRGTHSRNQSGDHTKRDGDNVRTSKAGDRSMLQFTIVSLPSVIPVPDKRSEWTLAAADRLIGRVATSCAVEEDRLIMIAAAAGYPFEDDDRNATLRERQIHVPLLGRLGGRLEFGVRCPSLVTTGDVPSTLTHFFGILEQTGQADDRSLCAELCGEPALSREAVMLRGPAGTCGWRTSDWFLSSRFGEEPSGDVLQATESAALFIKPDDFWDSLDVASQSPQIVEELTGRLRERISESGEQRKNRR